MKLLRTIFSVALLSLFAGWTLGADGQSESSWINHLTEKYNLSEEQAMAIATVADTPADAIIIIRLSLMADTSIENVLLYYQWHKKRGWGAIAREVGVTPGSQQFLAAVQGDALNPNATSGANKSSKGNSVNKSNGSKGQGKARNR